VRCRLPNPGPAWPTPVPGRLGSPLALSGWWRGGVKEGRSSRSAARSALLVMSAPIGSRPCPPPSAARRASSSRRSTITTVKGLGPHDEQARRVGAARRH
jgi:hypothetical protein